ncbi:T9SS type A sorting domain-containing protein [Patiriisocius hiemis]|uniref:T9SS type A sorting domain-containing protein n=1 Tax=Patiriisocius hiemis TaxID=3075604 RepID=A0ABU2YE60_9FLAO|nr:T9SS type A sorting domain-containing protein [Constantimarinum sp. W242]MDT0556479.1 T9SS type A sorting domain-containing protein [Constantimarinum sp. W242]
MKLKNYFFVALFGLFATIAHAQQQTVVGPTNTGMLSNPVTVPSIAKQLQDGTFKNADNTAVEGRPKRQRANNVIPGKGSQGVDKALQTMAPIHPSKAPLLTFTADISQATPSDPTGAVGPDHYVGAWNSAFRIFDKTGTPLTPEASLATIFPGNAIGDPIVFFDPFIENDPGEPRGRFVITEFDSSPNGFNVAVCQGPDPVNDGWYVYTTGFTTGAFPDYTKFAVWSDGYYVTANIGSSNRLFAVEREQMAKGEPAQIIRFPLPGISTSGFYSPHGFTATGGSEPELGDFCVVYLQDDAWGGVSDDHLKVWTVNVDWETTANSTISTPQEIITADFISVFDGGSFANLDQPGGPDIDALQATVMNQAQFRKFDGYNSALLNFVVDTDPTGGELAGIRWYELRQTAQGEPWTIFQEGTYIAPDGRDAFSGSMAMDIYGNIGMGYSSVSSTESISIRYTGRLADDPVNTMSIAEDLIIQGGNSPTTRFADYVHLTVDPTNDATFWHIAEAFDPTRRDVVGVFEHAVIPNNDVAIINLTPNTGELTNSEIITVEIKNYGTDTQTTIPVTYSVDGGTPIAEVYTGSIAAGETDTYEFTVPADLSASQTFRIETSTALVGDENDFNDVYGENVRNEGEILGVEDLQIENAELIVTSSDNKNFVITLTTTYDDVLPLSVYDVTGKQVVFNNLVRTGNKYRYELNMSYASSGVYLVNLGRGAVQKTAKIIVK